ncbi:MAG TPA: class I SAM-dependent methyltransferase [Spirochaetota bacterium]|nr:class I SAM-dependent methyltransferase [Spirochaetota bacterium]HNT11676.1 class I SAM-dependent methyltransferase [Spirochaetota bacterium]
METAKKTRVRFILPEANAFTPNNIDDPLPYYYKPVIGSLYRARIQAGLDLLAPPYRRVLEFGFGSGLLLPSLAGTGAEVHGIDLNSDPATVQRSLDTAGVKASLKSGDLLAAGYPGEYFDLIVAFSVFEHIADPGAILGEMSRITVAGGRLLVGMPRVDRVMERFFQFIGYQGIEKHHVTNHREFTRHAGAWFTLEKIVSMPSLLPQAAGLYYNMLFVKK